MKHGDKLKLKTGSRSTMLTLIIFALILCLMGLTAFTKKPTSPKAEIKKTETLDSVLVAKNFYRVSDAYAIKLYGQDEGMSFDVAGQRLFGSNIAIKDGLLYGSSLGDLTIEAYFQGEVSYLLEATQKLPVDKNRIKANHYSQDIVLNKVWTSLEGQETSNSIITQFQDKTLLKLRISYNKEFLPTKIQGFYNSQTLNGWRDLFYIDYPYSDQEAFNQAQDAYIQHIQYMETHPEEEAGEFG